MTTPHERDRSLELWLRAALPRTGAPTAACLDGEAIAAWLDGGLDASLRQQAETHVSSCARCQALVASIVAVEAADYAVAEPAPSRWRAWLNWMLPLGAVATAGLALAVWLNVPAPALRQSSAPSGARVESPASPAALTPQAAPTEAAQPPVMAARGEAGAAPSAAHKSAAPTAPALTSAGKAVASSPALGASTERSPAVAATTPETADAAANRAEAPPSVVAPSPAVAPAPAAPRARVAAAGGADASGLAAAQPDGAAGQAFAAREGSGLDVISPDPRVRWRLMGRALTRSTDGGTTWATVLPDAGAGLRAAAAPSTTVCWVAGEGGLVLRSLDGATFIRVTAPATADLAAVTASSGAAATVTTVDGRRFVTPDGGTTWSPAR